MCIKRTIAKFNNGGIGMWFMMSLCAENSYRQDTVIIRMHSSDSVHDGCICIIDEKEIRPIANLWHKIRAAAATAHTEAEKSRHIMQ